jgi:hypothetical protein
MPDIPLENAFCWLEQILLSRTFGNFERKGGDTNWGAAEERNSKFPPVV